MLKFFETLKKQLKKSESQINFEDKDVGHLIPLTVGHKNKPNEIEAQYIRSIINLSKFKYMPEEFMAVSPTPLNVGLTSALIPPILPSPNVVIKGSLSHRTLYSK